MSIKRPFDLIYVNPPLAVNDYFDYSSDEDDDDYQETKGPKNVPQPPLVAYAHSLYRVLSDHLTKLRACYAWLNTTIDYDVAVPRLHALYVTHVDQVRNWVQVMHRPPAFVHHYQYRPMMDDIEAVVTGFYAGS